jgi:prepilin peptidase CpaA
MPWLHPLTILPITLAALLVSAGIEDARRRQIANWKNGLIALLAPIWWWATGMSVWPDMAAQLGLALAVFALFIGAYALGQMGGGDVKMIGSVALWFPVQPLVELLITMAIIGGGLTILIVIERWWRKKTDPPEIPYGVAIALAALIVSREPLFNHFA